MWQFCALLYGHFVYVGAQGLSRMSAGRHLLASQSKSFTELFGFQRYEVLQLTKDTVT